MNYSIELPPIELPSFEGELENWPKFYESFKTSIFSNDCLNDSQSPISYGQVDGLSFKGYDRCYTIGWNLSIIMENLNKKYQYKRTLGTLYLNNILNVKNCVNTSESLGFFIEKFSASVSALQLLNFQDLTDIIFLHFAVRYVELPPCSDLNAFVQDKVRVFFSIKFYDY